MTLQDALDELRSGILRDATTLKSGPTEHFWSDDSLCRYINDAQNRFARLSYCIRDSSTPEVTQVALVGDGATDQYPLHTSIVAVVSARHQDDTTDLVRVGRSILGTQNPNTETFELASFPPDGKPTMFSTDEGTDQDNDHAVIMRVYGIPNDISGAGVQSGKTIYLRTVRKPMVTLDVTTLDQNLEIPSDYQLDMLEWAAYRALRNLDVDGEDRKKASDHKTRFEEAVAEARRDTLRKIEPPLLWRFGQNGFTYTHN